MHRSHNQIKLVIKKDKKANKHMKKVLHIINYQESKIPVTYYYKTSKLIPIND